MEHSALGTRGGLMTHRVQDGSWCSRRWLVPAIHMSTRTDFQRFAAITWWGPLDAMPILYYMLTYS